MKTLKALYIVAAAAALALSFGCSTPETRIRRNPELFAQLSPEQQELIRRGQVAVGFNAEMVRLALGEPDRYTTRSDQDGTSEVWHYVTYDAPTGGPLYRGWYHRYYMWEDRCIRTICRFPIAANASDSA
jgi:outer membrane protein assembly factor BamE (lipoprotein component of BamABCDE complex)